MNKRIAVITVIFTLHIGLKASVPDRPVAGSGAALGQIGIAINSPWSSMQNPAMLAWQKLYWIGIHHENRYLTQELGLSSIGATIPTNPGTFAISISHFGYNQFNTTRAGISYGMKFSEKFSAGIGLNFHHLQVAGDYSNRNAYSVEGGVLYIPAEKITLSAYIFNPTRASLNEQESMPTIFGFGFTYVPSNKLTLVLQIDDDTENKPAVRGGVEYKALNNFSVRLGYSSGNPEGLTGGFGWFIKGIQADLSFGYHRVLGYTPQLSVSYQFGKKSDKIQ